MANEITEYRDSPVDNIKKLLGSGLKVSDLKDFMEMQVTWEKREAEKSFHAAMSEFKKNPPTIVKSKKVSYKTSSGQTSYKHAELGDITSAIGSALSEHGLNATWMTDQSNGIKVTCTITHKAGHSQSTSLVSPPDTSGGKNSIQAIGSTISYLQRYTLLSLTGLAAHDQDDDGNNAEKEPEAPKELTPDSPNWPFAIKAYLRDGNLNAVLSKSTMTEENQKRLIEDAGLAKSEIEGAM